MSSSYYFRPISQTPSFPPLRRVSRYQNLLLSDDENDLLALEDLLILEDFSPLPLARTVHRPVPVRPTGPIVLDPLFV